MLSSWSWLITGAPSAQWASAEALSLFTDDNADVPGMSDHLVAELINWLRPSTGPATSSLNASIRCVSGGTVAPAERA
jgi:hypothetical protein